MARTLKKADRVVQGTIHYELSDSGRRDSLLSGGNGKSKQSVSGPVNEWILSRFTLDDDGVVSFDLTTDFHQLADEDEIQLPPHCHVSRDFVNLLYWDKVPTWEQLLGVVIEIDRVDAFRKATRAQTVAEFLNNPEARAKFTGKFAAISGDYFHEDSEAYREAVRRRDKDAEELKAKNRQTLANWISTNGSQNQRERLAARLLPWKEAHAAIDKSLFDHLENESELLTVYKRFEVSEVCVCPRGDYEPFCEPKFQTVDATEVTDSEWERLSVIKKVFTESAKQAGVTVAFQIREHSAKCTTAAEPLIRRGVIVKMTLDQLTFKREFALTGVNNDDIAF